MIKNLFVVMLSTSTVYWAIWGPIDVSSGTPAMVGVSTGPVANVILHSQTTPDCYQLIVTPNGTLGTQWTQCP